MLPKFFCLKITTVLSPYFSIHLFQSNPSLSPNHLKSYKEMESGLHADTSDQGWEDKDVNTFDKK